MGRKGSKASEFWMESGPFPYRGARAARISSSEVLEYLVDLCRLKTERPRTRHSVLPMRVDDFTTQAARSVHLLNLLSDSRAAADMTRTADLLLEAIIDAHEGELASAECARDQAIIRLEQMTLCRHVGDTSRAVALCGALAAACGTTMNSPKVYLKEIRETAKAVRVPVGLNLLILQVSAGVVSPTRQKKEVLEGVSRILDNAWKQQIAVARITRSRGPARLPDGGSQERVTRSLRSSGFSEGEFRAWFLYAAVKTKPDGSRWDQQAIAEELTRELRVPWNQSKVSRAISRVRRCVNEGKLPAEYRRRLESISSRDLDMGVRADGGRRWKDSSDER